MNYEVLAIPAFVRKAKKLVKKYPSFKTDLSRIIEGLKKDPVQGAPLGKDCYKIRMAITSKGKGKSGGARLITCIVIKEETVFLLTVYDKSEKENITDAELTDLLNELPEE